MLLATEPGPVKLYPALTVEPHATVAEFDERHPDGADYVMVPAMSRDDDPAVLAWLRHQASAYLVAMQLEYPRRREEGHLIRKHVEEAG